MSAPAPRVSPIASTLLPHTWWVLLLAAIALHGFATARRIDRVEAMTHLPSWSVDAPARDASSPTGFVDGQRMLIVPRHHNPSFWWIMEAQQTAAEGSWRLRHIDYDAAPEGRETSRTALYRWWLIAVGWLHGVVSGEPLGYAIERGALFADPLLLGLMLVAGATYCARFLGPMAAIGFVLGGIGLFPLTASFQPGAPDPHSLAWVLALGSILPLLASPQRTGKRRRTHFIVAGIFGGLGFWNDATSQLPVLLGIALGGIGYAWMRTRSRIDSASAPSPWRAWGIASGTTALAASLFEFAPHHFSWALDAVSPVHAVACWGLGEALRAMEVWFRQGRAGFDRRAVVLLGIAGLAIAAWPVVGVLTGSGGLLASDFYARELANHPAGGIARDLRAWLDRSDNSGAKWATLLPAVLLFVVAGRMLLGRNDAESRGRLLFVLLAALVAVVLASQQLRWWNLFDVVALVMLAALFAEVEVTEIRTRWKNVAAALPVLPGLFVGFPTPSDATAVADLSPGEAQALIARDFSHWLVKRAGAEPIVLYSTPMFGGAGAFYGGFKAVVSTDDENEAGHQVAVRITSISTEQEAAVLLESRGITHVVLPLWDPLLDHFVRIGRNLPADEPLPANAFSVSLREWDIPLWMQPMNYTIPPDAGLQEFELRAFARGVGQEPELALSRLADLFLERRLSREAQAVRERLEDFPRSVVALGAAANVDLALRESERLTERVEKLIPYLSRRAGRDLPPDRRISLATLFMQINRVELARDQLTACFAELDAATLRTMTPGTVVRLVALSRALDLPFPEPGLESVALELIPPSLRAGLGPKTPSQ